VNQRRRATLDPVATKTTIDKAMHTIRFERTLTAAREQVFEAWTRAEHGPPG
jgi:hypothetical protein